MAEVQEIEIDKEKVAVAKDIVLFSRVHGYEIKETDEGYIVKGYIATTHLDSGCFDTKKQVWVKDRISKDTLSKWAGEINAGNPRANKVSVHHEREPHVTGVGIKGTPRVDKFKDGEYGLYVETLIDKTKETFADLAYRIENGLLDSFSIEFMTKDPATSAYYDGAVKEDYINGSYIRTLLPGTSLEGWTLASQPMNEYAIMIKEILTNANLKSIEEKEVKEESKMEQEIIKSVPTVSQEELGMIKEYKEFKAKELKEKEFQDLKGKLMTELKETLSKVEVKDKVQKNPDNTIEMKEYKDYKEVISNSKSTVAEQFAVAGKLADKLGLTMGSLKMDSRPAEAREYKSFSTKGNKLEYKGLGLTTNQNTDTDYLLSAAELSDVFDPVVYNALNQATVSWNLFAKDDYSMKGNNQVQFVLKTAINSTVGAYTGNAVSTGNTTRLKFQTKFKKYAVGIEVDGDMIAAARGGPIGDVFAQEVSDSTTDLLQLMNQDLFAEVGLESAAGVIGFEYITDGVGNATLYNVTRSAANKLLATTATDTYINGSSADLSLSNLRAAKRQALKEGAKIENLVFISDHIQGDKLRKVYDDAQRMTPTSARFGFEGMMSFDGIPFFEDKDCNDDDVWLVDLETHRIAVWVPPTLEMLGKDSDSEKGFIKTYWATYNRAPRRMVQIYGNSTS